jgi:hypothetical protein
MIDTDRKGFFLSIHSIGPGAGVLFFLLRPSLHGDGAPLLTEVVPDPVPRPKEDDDLGLGLTTRSLGVL